MPTTPLEHTTALIVRMWPYPALAQELHRVQVQVHHDIIVIPYSGKLWRGFLFGKLAILRKIAKFKTRQYYFTHYHTMRKRS